MEVESRTAGLRGRGEIGPGRPSVRRSSVAESTVRHVYDAIGDRQHAIVVRDDRDGTTGVVGETVQRREDAASGSAIE
jgi:hypothetical protein